MYYIALNDASVFECSDLITEGTVELKGEKLKAIFIPIQNASLDLIRSKFGSEFNTRTITLMSENKVPMTVYDNYSMLKRIATDEVAIAEEEEGASNKYMVTMVMPSDLTTLVPQLQERIEELEAEIIELTAEPDPSQMSLDELKEYKIMESKDNLDEWLASHPITSTVHDPEGAKYSITLEKQTLLANAITLANIHKMNNDDTYKISWNATGEENTYDWTLDQLQQLFVEIDAVVSPLVDAQQKMENAIKVATSKEDVLKVSLDFSTVEVSTPVVSVTPAEPAKDPSPDSDESDSVEPETPVADEADKEKVESDESTENLETAPVE